MNFKFLDEYINTHSPGYDILIYKDGEISEYIFGNKCTLPKEEKLTSDTLFDIASLTKVFTATLIYMAYEENKLDINDYVYDIDNRFTNLKSVKILDLLSHNQEIYTDGYLGSTSTKQEFEKILFSAYVKDKTPKYIDADYIILSYILEKIYNTTFEKIVYEKVCIPLNLSNITFNPIKENCASCDYEYQGDILIRNEVGIVHDKKAKCAYKFGMYVGHAGIFSNGLDLIKFLKSFLDNTLLKKETIELMLKHDDRNSMNYNILKDLTHNDDNINNLYEESLDIDSSLHLIDPHNYMGCLYKNKINKLNLVDLLMSDTSINFSGFTGPMFSIDFENKIIVLVMCNILHNTHFERLERKMMTKDILHEVIKQIPIE